MPDLEQKISEWRKDMLAAGIKFPVPLEELESHLREEIEWRLKSGVDERRAFAAAADQFGHAAVLKKEFNNAGGFAEKLGEQTAANRALGLLWLVFCLGSFYKLTNGLMSNFPAVHITPLFVFAWLMEFIYLRGIVASVLFFGGVMRERRFILFLAVLDAFGGIAFLLLKTFQPLSFAFTILGFITIWRLWPGKLKLQSKFNHV